MLCPKKSIACSLIAVIALWPAAIFADALVSSPVTETDFLRECDASFKQGSQFVGWVDGSHSDAYYHPFTLPVGYEERNLAPYWLEDPRGQSFAGLFNDTYRYRWERIVDFLKLHYALSRRSDSRFWIDNRARESIPDTLNEYLEFWRDHCPWHEDFSHREEVFSAASYQYILYGMGFQTRPASWLLNDRDRNLAREKMNEAALHVKALAASLPSNRELLSKVRRYGLQKV